MAQSTYTDKETGQSEPVIVFKHVGLEEKIKRRCLTRYLGK